MFLAVTLALSSKMPLSINANLSNVAVHHLKRTLSLFQVNITTQIESPTSACMASLSTRLLAA
jgi:hypothetical protein